MDDQKFAAEPILANPVPIQPAVHYICAKCKADVMLRPQGDVLKCGRCLHRILHKTRQNKKYRYYCV